GRCSPDPPSLTPPRPPGRGHRAHDVTKFTHPAPDATTVRPGRSSANAGGAKNARGTASPPRTSPPATRNTPGGFMAVRRSPDRPGRYTLPSDAGEGGHGRGVGPALPAVRGGGRPGHRRRVRARSVLHEGAPRGGRPAALLSLRRQPAE